MSGRKIFV